MKAILVVILMMEHIKSESRVLKAMGTRKSSMVK